jgi:hypothetical protein
MVLVCECGLTKTLVVWSNTQNLLCGHVMLLKTTVKIMETKVRSVLELCERLWSLLERKSCISHIIRPNNLKIETRCYV